MKALKIWIYLGQIFVAGLIITGLCMYMSGARAEPGVKYELVFALYSSADGHKLALPSFLDVIRVAYPWPTEEVCDQVGADTVKRYHPGRHPSSLTADLLEWQCIKVTTP